MTATRIPASCPQDHPWPENLRTDSRGWRYCAECDRVRARRWYAENRPPAQPDEIAIERAAAGDPPGRLTPRERRAAILQLAGRQLSARQIADRVGCSERTVWRVLACRATPAALAPAV